MEAETMLRSGNRPSRVDALKRLPDDVDPQLACSAALELLGDGWKGAWVFARTCQRFPPTVIDCLLQTLHDEAKTDPVRIFLREALRLGRGASLQEDWATALRAVLDLDTTYAWGSRQLKAKFRELAADPRMLGAIQAAVVAAPRPPASMLGVLATDGGEASVDALLVVFADAANDALLERLGTHAASTPAMKALLEQTSARRQAKAAASPALTFARKVLGLEVPTLSVRFWLQSVETTPRGVPAVQGALTIDNAEDAWWSVSVARITGALGTSTVTRFGAAGLVRDDCGLGACTPEELPSWLALAAQTLGVQWREGDPSGSLRGKKREAARRWLFGR